MATGDKEGMRVEVGHERKGAVLCPWIHAGTATTASKQLQQLQSRCPFKFSCSFTSWGNLGGQEEGRHDCPIAHRGQLQLHLEPGCMMGPTRLLKAGVAAESAGTPPPQLGGSNRRRDRGSGPVELHAWPDNTVGSFRKKD